MSTQDLQKGIQNLIKHGKVHCSPSLMHNDLNTINISYSMEVDYYANPASIFRDLNEKIVAKIIQEEFVQNILTQKNIEIKLLKDQVLQLRKDKAIIEQCKFFSDLFDEKLEKEPVEENSPNGFQQV